MGKNDSKTNKHKEDRLARKQLQYKIADAMKLVNKANSIETYDPLVLEHVLYSKGDLTVNIQCKKISEIDQVTVDWILDLTERNMKKLYEACAWGWAPKKKATELTEDSALYLIARSGEGKNIAFSHFRFDMDFDEAVLYCYELQVEEDFRRRGLGEHLLSALEVLASRTGMIRVRLTALKHNPKALKFFQKHGYKEDDTSPEPEEAVHYLILSKLIVQQQSTTV